MKVVLATHRTNQYLGVNKYFYLLGKHLRKLGVEVFFTVDSRQGYEIVGEICGAFSRANISPTAINPVTTLRYCHILSNFLGLIDFDILHCGHILPFFYLRRKERKPVVFQPFGNELFTLAGRGMNPLYCKLARPFLSYCGNHADVLLAEGEFQVEEMRRYYPKHKSMEILPVGVETSNEVHRLYFCNNRPFQFLAVNSLLPYEGMDDLIYAFRGVSDGSKLVIVGSGSEEKKLKMLASDMNVEFKKNIPEKELESLYINSDCFISPTYETDMQMSILEALSLGLPVISRQAGWLPDSVVQYRNILELRQKMQWYASTTPSERAERGKKGVKEVEQYSFTEIAKTALKIYETLI